MSILKIFETRFADPITAIELNSKGLMHGSIMGRLVYYSFINGKEIQITEVSEELIRGVY
jgi:hypothetical protein